MEKTLNKVSKFVPQQKRPRYDRDKSDLRSFLARGASAQRGGSKNTRQTNPPHSSYTKFKGTRYFKPSNPRNDHSRRAEVEVSQEQVEACSGSLGVNLCFIPHFSTLPLAGRVRVCVVNWLSISNDPWILEGLPSGTYLHSLSAKSTESQAAVRCRTESGERGGGETDHKTGDQSGPRDPAPVCEQMVPTSETNTAHNAQ